MGKGIFPEVEVAVTLITCKRRFLLVFNPKWGSFTFPMTKRRQWEDPNTTSGTRVEDWLDAAVRAATECFGKTSTSTPKLVLEDLIQFQQSDSDGKWKRYQFKVFRLLFDKDPELISGAITEWLEAKDILDERRRPISPTARELIKRLQAEAQLQGKTFP